ncbi:hypothetical protein LTR56_025675 [Elasticomyces elasticus]|nr:hypothetical protein LTR56_025675 [Elasticomyces elasticus]KAK5729584.1 hypothetical protein LTS12_027327 [Elasticomyces elasticus]
MPGMGSDYSTLRGTQYAQQGHLPAEITHNANTLSAATAVQRARNSIDTNSGPWLTDMISLKSEPTEAPLLPTSTSTIQKRTRRSDLARPKGRRMPHNLIERRYRDNLNLIETLRDELPTFKSIVACTADMEDVTGKWPSKAVVIAAAVQYIAQLTQERGHAIERNSLLRDQVEGLQKLVRCDDCAIVKYLETMQSCVPFGQ